MQVVSNGRALFQSAFAQSCAQFEVNAPGRVNLIGEHTDYNGGKVLPFAISLGTTLGVRIAQRADFRDFQSPAQGALFVMASDVSEDVFMVGESEIRDHMLRRGMLHCADSDVSILAPETKASWAKYAFGALVVFFEANKGKVQLPEGSVVAISVEASLPLGSGLSSSASLCVGMISALCFAFGKHISSQQIAHLAMTVEHRFAGTKCGLMDQLAIMNSKAGGFTCIDFASVNSSENVAIQNVKAHRKFDVYTPVAFHTGVAHSLASSEYNARRLSCENALLLLNSHSGVACAALGEYAQHKIFKRVFGVARDNAHQQQLVELLARIFASAGDKALELARRSAHAIWENVRVDAAIHAIMSGNFDELDAAMRESHESLNSDYEVSCAELNEACVVARSVAQQLAHASHISIPGIIGPRMTGGGFGGSTIQFVHNAILEKFVETFRDSMNPYTRKTGCTPKLIVSQPQNGLRISIV